MASCSQLWRLCDDRTSYFGHIPRDISRIIIEFVRWDCIPTGIGTDAGDRKAVLKNCKTIDICDNMIMYQCNNKTKVIDIMTNQRWKTPGGRRLLSSGEYWSVGAVALDIRTGKKRDIPIVINVRVRGIHIFLDDDYPFYADGSIYLIRDNIIWARDMSGRYFMPKPELPHYVQNRCTYSYTHTQFRPDYRYFLNNNKSVGGVHNSEVIFINGHAGASTWKELLEHPAGALINSGDRIWLARNDRAGDYFPLLTISDAKLIHVYMNNMVIRHGKYLSIIRLTN